MADTFVIFDAEAKAQATRRCGDCQLCCKLLPVRALDKPANTRCKHQRFGKGCTVYRQPGMPMECGIWSCRWLFDPDTAALSRPDRTHYVIDCMPDSIGIEAPDGRATEIMVMQVWIDPAFPNAHHDPALRALVKLVAERDNMPTMIRIGSVRAFILAAPCFMPDGKWSERPVTREATESGTRLLDQMIAGKI